MDKFIGAPYIVRSASLEIKGAMEGMQRTVLRTATSMDETNMEAAPAGWLHKRLRSMSSLRSLSYANHNKKAMKQAGASLLDVRILRRRHCQKHLLVS